MLESLNSSQQLRSALVSHDEELRSIFQVSCAYSGSIPVIAEDARSLEDILEGKCLHHMVIDMSLPEDLVTALFSMRSKQPEWSCVPVTSVVSGLHHSISSHYMFTKGICDIVERSIKTEDFADILARQIQRFERWSKFSDGAVIDQKMQICADSMRSVGKGAANLSATSHFSDKYKPQSFDTLIEHLCTEFSLDSKEQRKMRECMPECLYDYAHSSGIPRSYVLQLISENLMLPHLTSIDFDKLIQGHFPPDFCRDNRIIPLRLYSNSCCLALGNPYDWELIEFLFCSGELDEHTRLLVIDPEQIDNIFSLRQMETALIRPSHTRFPKHSVDATSTEDLENHIFEAAVRERATDIHIEPKAESTIIRFRVDGDLHDFANLCTGAAKLVCRLKNKAGMDIAESRHPQDGGFHSTILGRRYRVRAASTLSQFGESLSLRILETDAGLNSLTELGMHDVQEQLLLSLSAMHSGMMIFVGPTGSGKTTTIYSTLNHVDCQTRSLISVEDPIEYSIPHANQQQVNDKAGSSYEVLLKSSVRQDPDILFIGEIRDTNSAKIAMDFTSTGRLTLTSMHTPNATTALFRLERLGISRSAISEAVLAIIAQRLVKKLCSCCKNTVPISNADRAMLQAYFSTNLPDVVAYPVGCERCGFTGYHGRTGIYEIMHITPEISEMIEKNRSIAEIRQTLIVRGDFMMPSHALEKVKDLLCSPTDIQNAVLLEEVPLAAFTKFTSSSEIDMPPQEVTNLCPNHSKMLIVEDDPDTMGLLERFLNNQGYVVDTAVNGLEALVKLGNTDYSLIISDIMMPDLDGFSLLEIMKQKNIETPVILMTALSDENSELRGFELGAVDYIHKPIKLEILKMRIDRFVKPLK